MHRVARLSYHVLIALFKYFLVSLAATSSRKIMRKRELKDFKGPIMRPPSFPESSGCRECLGAKHVVATRGNSILKFRSRS